MNWTEQDRKAFAERGWTAEEADAQVQQLRTGHKERRVRAACTEGDGVVMWTERERLERSAFAQRRMREGYGVAGFVPASGAATRMFKDLHPPVRPEVATRLEADWQRLPFAALLEESDGSGLADQILNKLAYQHLPKGHVPFFAQPSGQVLTAFDAHREEWRLMGGSDLVFTVPATFRSQLPERYARWQGVHWDVQHPETDTLAWDAAAQAPARTRDGALLFRPGGHGALLANLSALTTDAAVVRNIDNAVPPAAMPGRNAWRMALIGAACHLAEEREALWSRLERGEADAERTAWQWLSAFVNGADMPRTLDQWHFHLNRPIRVAGVVPNAGQPGGGPFWVADADGFFRPGIAEASELPDGALAEGTHFNPVELALHFRGLGGMPLRLPDFADGTAFFTPKKVVEGQTLQVLERPGLWNGGMAGWLTRFVELPAEVFAPVKTVFDLIRD